MYKSISDGTLKKKIVLREDGVRRLDYRAGTAIHAVSRSKHVRARLQHVLQSHIILVLDHVNPKDL